MISKAAEIFNYKYREVFDSEKTAKAFGYSRVCNRVEEFFRLCKSTCTADEGDDSIYRVLLHTLGIPRKNKSEELLRKLCACSRYDISVDEFDVRYREFCEAAEHFDANNLEDSAIELLIYTLITLGLFSAALLFRQKYEEKILRSGSTLQKYSVYYQNGSFPAALYLLYNSRFFCFFRLVHRQTFYSMERSLLPLVYPEKADRSGDFAQYLQGKSVYIIGPSDNNAPVVLPDENRLVIRYAYMGRDNVGGAYKNVLTDISYYNGAHASRVAAMEQTDFLSELSYAVLKYRLQSSFWDQFEPRTKVRYADRAPYTMQHGVSPNMLQIVLTDLIPLGKLNLTVLDNNLYLNRNYTEGYASNQVRKKMDDYAFAAQFAKHDVFCNFKFTKALFEQGFFSADERLTEILAMSPGQFAEAMEAEYGHSRSL